MIFRRSLNSLGPPPPLPLFRENLLRFLGKSNHLGFVKPLFLSNPNTRHEHAELIISAKCIALTILWSNNFASTYQCVLTTWWKSCSKICVCSGDPHHHDLTFWVIIDFWKGIFLEKINLHLVWFVVCNLWEENLSPCTSVDLQSSYKLAHHLHLSSYNEIFKSRGKKKDF